MNDTRSISRARTDSVAVHPSFVAPRLLNPLAKLVVLGMMLLVAVGVVVALSNLPVVTGCVFYGNCDFSPPTEPPSELGVSPVE